MKKYLLPMFLLLTIVVFGLMVKSINDQCKAWDKVSVHYNK